MPDRAASRSRLLAEVAAFGRTQSHRFLRSGARARLCLRQSGEASRQDPPRPLHADRAWRPAPWARRLEVAERTHAATGTQLAFGIALHHDDDRASPGFVQRGETVPFGLSLLAQGFRGNYLSLSLELPADVLSGLHRDHLVGVTATLGEAPVARVFARLNIRHGPNLAEVTREIAPAQARRGDLIEFDLRSVTFEPGRVSEAWLDLILEGAQSSVTICDLVVSRRPRAPL